MSRGLPPKIDKFLGATVSEITAAALLVFVGKWNPLVLSIVIGFAVFGLFLYFWPEGQAHAASTPAEPAEPAEPVETPPATTPSTPAPRVPRRTFISVGAAGALGIVAYLEQILRRSSVDGKVFGSDGKTYSGVKVVAWKTGGSRRKPISGFVGLSDGTGVFKLRNLPVGNYRLIAFRPVQNLLWANTLVRDFEEGAQHLTDFALEEMASPANLLSREDDRFHFDSNSSELDTPANRIALSIASKLHTFDGYILLSGHADEVGDASYNEGLGLERALAVAKALMAQHISPHRIVCVSFGSQMPLDKSNGALAYMKNRRVEVELLPTSLA